MVSCLAPASGGERGELVARVELKLFEQHDRLGSHDIENSSIETFFCRMLALVDTVPPPCIPVFDTFYDGLSRLCTFFTFQRSYRCMSDDDDLAAEIRELRSEVDTLHHRVGKLESIINREAAPGDRPTADDESTRTAPQEQQASDTEGPTTPPPEQQDGDDSAAPTRAESADKRGTDDDCRNWERDIGTKWLGRVGSVTLVFGIVFFIRVAIETGILGPLGRVTAGVVGGTALLAGGRYATHRQGYERWGRITAGTGLAITFFSVYAAYGFESYRTAIGTPLWAVLLGLTVLVGSTVVVSVYDGSSLVAGEAFLLGYVTAYLGLNSGSFVVTPAYALLLTLGLVLIATIRPWSRYVTVSIPLTYGIIIAWLADFDPAWGVVAGVIVAVFAIYAAGSSVLRRGPHTDVWNYRLLQALTPLNAVFAATLLEWTVRKWFPELPVEGIAVGGVALALGGIYAGTTRQSGSRDDTAGIAAVVLLGVSVVLAAGTFAATVGLLAIVCGAVAAAWDGTGDATRTGAHLVAVGTVIKLLAVDARELTALTLSEPVATATGRPAAFLLVIGALYGLAWWFRDDTLAVPSRDEDVTLAIPYVLTATALTGVVLGLELSGFVVSVAWATFGAVLFGSGLRTDARLFRLQGVIVFGVTTAKVFLFDTQGLDTVARTVSFLVLGSFLLAASYAYARWQGDRPLDRLTGT